MSGVVNAPENRTLRRDIVELGMPEICAEVMSRPVALKLNPDDPALGRFFPARCNAKVQPSGDVVVELAGAGYAWSNLTKRIGFEVAASLDYELDFQLDGSTAYVYFRPKLLASRTFKAMMVEETALPGGALTSILPGETPDAFVARVGDGLLAQMLGEGFTVVREADGDTSFTIGTTQPGDPPIVGFARDDERYDVYANERSEIHVNQRDYLGPINVPPGSDALFLTLAVEGAPQVDVQVYPRTTIEPWLLQYLTQRVASAAPGAPIFDDTIVPSPAGEPARKIVRVPPGQYFVVLDNTASAGRTAPPPTANDDRAALVHVGVEVGKAP
ncbi:MAG: hypothetical protein IPM79_08735 [Polyangiaceae bacterium]|jgi:hypothetical protein|nr:hypothetical protein [Polyangiaceae bacterium]MBK8937715.1 hypothetical protein [Polyangiaceae bacterium]